MVSACWGPLLVMSLQRVRPTVDWSSCGCSSIVVDCNGHLHMLWTVSSHMLCLHACAAGAPATYSHQQRLALRQARKLIVLRLCCLSACCCPVPAVPGAEVVSGVDRLEPRSEAAGAQTCQVCWGSTACSSSKALEQ
jgi:hypothetical protein